MCYYVHCPCIRFLLSEHFLVSAGLTENRAGLGTRYFSSLDCSLVSSDFLPKHPFSTETSSSKTGGHVSSDDSKANMISARMSSVDTSNSL